MILEEQSDLTNKLINAGIEKQEAEKELSILVKEFGASNLDKIQNIVNKRIETREPIQYLLGKAYFMDFEVKVNKNVLIPRSETEILIEETVKRLKTQHVIARKDKVLTKQSVNASQNEIASLPKAVRNDAFTILDIGTGSGIIAIALARSISDIKITAIDVNQDIINLAKENAKNCGVINKIDFQVCDLFSNRIEEILKTNRFDLIISNPPYIKEENWHKLSPEVSKHEPKVALTGSRENKTGLVYYEKILDITKQYIPKIIALEIDPSLVNDLKLLLKKHDLNNYEIIKDYAKLDRCLFLNP